ncbi:hypothetical protein [Pyxidicoccus xibeiensis]|nr:hypothetical protein [Pyxidicoccus xibeiensis]MCP3138261.1 hypothetical protein [Pyxidicoccus xibeiensis]
MSSRAGVEGALSFDRAEPLAVVLPEEAGDEVSYAAADVATIVTHYY